MFKLFFTPLVGGLLLFLGLPAPSICTPSSIPFTIRGSGVQFVDSPVTPDNVGVLTSDNTAYFVDLTLGGLNVSLILDTGSSDLFVLRQGRDINLTNSTTIEAEEVFGKGAVRGNIAFADVKLGDFTIHSQAFLDAVVIQDLGSSSDGIIGMSFNAPSSIQNAIANAFGMDVAQQIGNTPMPALFAQQPDLPDSFDVQLARANGLNDLARGTFLIGEHAASFTQVSAAPQLPSVSTDHWSVVMDAMNINGKPFKFNASRIQGVPEGKVAAVLDTGFSFPPLPAPAVDAIYSSIPGAVFDAGTALWFVPCSASTNLSFVFAGQEFFVNPLDLTIPVSGPLGIGKHPDQNVTICINTFQYLTLDPEEFVGFDLILGDAFLRNVYASFNYGNKTTGPFVQMVTTTPDLGEAIESFQQQRASTLAQLPPTIAPNIIEKEEGSISSNGERRLGVSSGHTVLAGALFVLVAVFCDLVGRH